MRPVLRLLCAASVVAAAGPALVPVLTASPAAASGTAPAWTVPVKLDAGGAEPGVKIPPDGRSAAYVTAPGPSGSNFWRINEAVDSAGNTSLTSSPGVQPDMGTGGGDAEISVGRTVDPTTGCAPIAYSGLHNIDLLDNFTVATSKDCGKTFSLLNPYATQNTLTDRQWQTFDGDLVNHLLYHKVDTGQIVDSRSEDGGQTYLTLGTPTGATGVIDAPHAYTLQNVKIGNVVTDYSRPIAGQTYPISGQPVHRLWATFAGSRDAADAAAAQAGAAPTGPSFDHLDTIYVAHSDDGGQTWTDITSYSTAPTETRELDLIFPVLSVDKAGNLYSAWTDGNLVQYVTSRDGGTTWSKPYTLTSGEAGAAKTNGTANLFPWIEAGGDGRLDVVWYHGEGGDTTGYRSVGDSHTTWTVAFAQLSNAASGGTGTPTPTVEQKSLAVSPVLHTGNVCNNGTTCGITDSGDRTLLDFFQVAVDGQGRANIVYADDQGSAGTAHVEYIRQNSGLSLINGSAIRPNTFATGGPTCTPDGTITDPAGDATGAAVVDSTPAPSQDDLDVLRGWFSTAGSSANETLTTHIKVTDLGTTGGEYFRFYFSYGTTSYLTTASRDASGATDYALEANGTTGATSLKTITGSFNPATNEVTATFSLADFNSTAKPTTPLASGASLGGLQVLGQRSEGAGPTLTADTATGACPYVVGTAPLPATATSSAPAPTADPTADPSAAPSTGGNRPAITLTTRTPTISAGSTATLVGKGGANQDYSLQCYTRPSTSYTQARSGSFDNAGDPVTFTLSLGRNTRCFLRYVTNPTQGASGSVVVNVKTVLSLSTVRQGVRKYLFQGRNLPRAAGQLITLYRVDSAGHEIRTSNLTTDSTGTYRVTRTFTGSGSYRFRVRTSQTNDNAAGVSNTITVDVH
jgi:hypothetical protein